jgi:coenzyme F420-reducing hydrogenase alpha subunit
MPRRLEIEPVSRVEGHGRITVTLQPDAPPMVELGLTESPRLFEQLLLGRTWDEAADIACRICSICSSVHKVVAVQAVEQALGAEISAAARLWRQLLVIGGQIESHSLHLFALTLPDLLDLPGLPALAKARPELVRQGLAVKAAGNAIQETVGGRLIHPPNVVVGGIAKQPTTAEQQELSRRLADVIPFALDAVRLFCDPPIPCRLPLHTPLAVASPPETPLFGDRIVWGSSPPAPVASYRQFLTEEYRKGTSASLCTVAGTTVITGAMPRLLLGSPLSPLAAQLFYDHRERLLGRGMEANPLAQAIEMVSALEDARAVLAELGKLGSEPARVPVSAPSKGTGIACIEAPRGTLIHSYSFDDNGICSAADIVTPTAFNQVPLQEDLSAVATQHAHLPDHELLTLLQRVIRCYDPCISCAVHLIRL